MLDELKEIRDKINWLGKVEGSLTNSMKTEVRRELIHFDDTLRRLILTCLAINKSNVR